MGKDIRKHAVEILVFVVGAGIIAFCKLYADYREGEIVASLKDVVRAESEQICQQIKTEQKHRCQLAAVLLKSGLDLPTDCLVAFSSGQCEDQSNKMLLKAVSQQAEPLELEDDYLAFLEQTKGRGADYPAIAPLDRNTYLIASLNTKPSGSPDTARQCVAEVRLRSLDTQDKVSELKATCFGSVMDFLRQPDITTGSLKTIRVKSIVKQMDPNRPREKTH